MSVINRRSVLTFFICAVIFISLPIGVYFTFKSVGSRMITQDNAGIVFDEFQAALDKGAMIHDNALAIDVAEQSYHERMHQYALDGWGRQFRFYASAKGSTCVLTLQSAGPDGTFGTADDISLSRTYDLSVTNKPATRPTTKPS